MNRTCGRKVSEYADDNMAPRGCTGEVRDQGLIYSACSLSIHLEEIAKRKPWSLPDRQEKSKLPEMKPLPNLTMVLEPQRHAVASKLVGDLEVVLGATCDKKRKPTDRNSMYVLRQQCRLGWYSIDAIKQARIVSIVKRYEFSRCRSVIRQCRCRVRRWVVAAAVVLQEAYKGDMELDSGLGNNLAYIVSTWHVWCSFRTAPYPSHPVLGSLCRRQYSIWLAPSFLSCLVLSGLVRAIWCRLVMTPNNKCLMLRHTRKIHIIIRLEAPNQCPCCHRQPTNLHIKVPVGIFPMHRLDCASY